MNCRWFITLNSFNLLMSYKVHPQKSLQKLLIKHKLLIHQQIMLSSLNNLRLTGTDGFTVKVFTEEVKSAVDCRSCSFLFSSCTWDRLVIHEP